ncbi:hypothetical protein DM47_2744 [Burkholderia mallei]|nr:hypothetical protein DP42_5278 [Burkholderia pseudomallei]KOS94104.1 hypothetical protein DM45_3387 [Burkholderia mallei]KGD50899.1 hypothetical protein DP43_4869 [Burkholderia pseudomallei]KOT02652.1 hypothetical protein DM50_3341 [Burkholderia mallei]KOT20931.1 hypothetical protein DM47_2744 [Burkholderia mallei]
MAQPNRPVSSFGGGRRRWRYAKAESVSRHVGWAGDVMVGVGCCRVRGAM